MANSVVYLIGTLIGYLLQHFLPAGAWSAYVPILVSYHVFLLWLFFNKEKKGGFSLPIGLTVLTHLACLMLLVGLAYARHNIPFFGLIRYLIPALAPFEVNWLISESTKASEPVPEAGGAAVATNEEAEEAIFSATAEDNEEWIKYLRTRNSLSRKPGMSIKEEYEQWMVARARKRSPAS